MTKTNLIQLSNQELNEMVVAYQANPTEFAFNDIYYAVCEMAHHVAYKYYNTYTSLTAIKDEYVQCANIAIGDAVNKFDIEKGSNFTSLVKQLVDWKINDEILKKSKNGDNKFYNAALSFDKPLSSDGGTFMDVVEHQFSTDIDSVFEALVEEKAEDIDSLGSILTGLVMDFSDSASKDDIAIIKTWVTTILSLKDLSKDTKKAVNKAIESVLPEVSSASLRKKKSRAVKKFNTFAQENGFSSFDLSQF
ncbi:hypothetical protein ABEU97_20415 [Priestia megaterium]